MSKQLFDFEDEVVMKIKFEDELEEIYLEDISLADYLIVLHCKSSRTCAVLQRINHGLEVSLDDPCSQYRFLMLKPTGTTVSNGWHSSYSKKTLREWLGYFCHDFELHAFRTFAEFLQWASKEVA